MKPAITYIADAPIPSKAANCVQTLQMTSALRRAGCDVQVVAPYEGEAREGISSVDLQGRYSLSEVPRLVHLPFLSIAGRLRASYFPLAALYSKFSSRRFVMTRNARVANAAAQLGLRVILESHSVPNTPRMRRAFDELAGRDRLALWIFISQRLQTLCAPKSLSSAKSIVLHDGVDLARFTPEMSKRAAREALATPTEGRVIAHVGSLYEGRGAEDLIAVLPRMPADTSLWFIGGRPEDAARLKRTLTPSLATRVHFFGHRPLSQLPRFYFAADVLALPFTTRTAAIDGTITVDYASPMKLFEYLAAARPIVTSRFAGICEVAIDRVNALVVPPDERESMAAALLTALTDENLSRRLSSAARTTAEEHTWDLRARSILDRISS